MIVRYQDNGDVLVQYTEDEKDKIAKYIKEHSNDFKNKSGLYSVTFHKNK